MLTKKIIQFLEYFKSIGYSRKSIEGLRTQLSGFNCFVIQERIDSLSDISYSHLLKLITCGQTVSPSVTKTRVWALKQFFQYLMLKKIVSHNIAADLPYPKIEKKEPYFLSLSDFQNILTQPVNQVNRNTGGAAVMVPKNLCVALNIPGGIPSGSRLKQRGLLTLLYPAISQAVCQIRRGLPSPAAPNRRAM